ncbi:MAG: EAL domain-containing protein [Gloeomargaritaceae cyanobacterium C42_A2020_066]|nr:EAL domain-containing protein [Gloeomargaritaceae cyanobacterium C42_A2020_066]
MSNWHGSIVEHLPPEDWQRTPETVRQFVEQLLADESCSASSGRLGQFLNATPIGIGVHDAAGNLIYINQSGAALLGVTTVGHVSTDALSTVFRVYRAGTRELYPIENLPSTRALAGISAWADDLEIDHPERVIPLEVSASPVCDDQGQVTHIIATFQDISERKTLETARRQREMEQEIIRNTLLASEHRYRQILQAQTDLILRSLPDTTITFANEALCMALGRPLAEVIGSRWSDFVLPNEVEAIHRKIAALTPAAPCFENLNRDYRAHHAIGWTQWINRGIFDEQGQLVELQSVGRDITTLQESILREKALNQVSQAIRNSLDLDTIFTTATRETAQLFGSTDCYVVEYFSTLGIWRHIAEFHCSANATITLGLEIPDAGNPFAEELKQLRPVSIEDTSTIQDEINREFAQTTPGAWLLIPLVIEGALWGAFTLRVSQRPFAWREEQVQLAQAVASQLEVAIHQANLYHQAKLELEERLRIEQALKQSEQRFRNLFENTPEIAVQGYDKNRQAIYWNRASEKLYGYCQDEAIGQKLEDLIIPPHMRQQVIEDIERWLDGGEPTPASELSLMRKDGSAVEVYSSHIMLVNTEGDPELYCVDIDLSDRNRAKSALHESESRYRLLAENMNDLVCLHDLDGRYLYVSPSCEQLLGYTYDEMLGRDPYEFFHPDDRERIRQEAHAAVVEGKSLPITYQIRQKSGAYIWFETLTKPITDETGQLVKLQTTSRDVTERIHVQHQLRHDALHDSLTGLPNRHLLMERLELAINRAKRLENYRFAVLFLDLDRFKVINDSLGHAAGDELLIAVAHRLQQRLRSLDLVARLGGDEFVILLEEVADIQEVICATERIFTALQNPFLIEAREVYTTASVGIVIGTSAYQKTDHLLRDADTAMYRAKSKGKSRYEIFDAGMHAQALARLHLENDLRGAIEREEFILHYQPIVHLETGELVGFESLIRWQHPHLGLRFPGDFITAAEETGLITNLDYWALGAACQQLMTWQSASPSLKGLKITVNLSAQDLRRDDLLTVLNQALSQWKIPRDCLTLEITESMLIEDVELTIDLLTQIKTQGLQISIDDFGTGYSSLNYLHRLPVDYLKVDRSFVSQIQAGRPHHRIVEMIMALSSQLELDVIAEGIETQEQLDYLKQIGCHYGQGYLFSRPMGVAAVDVLLAQGRLSFAETAH